jgi:hypothetical protein
MKRVPAICFRILGILAWIGVATGALAASGTPTCVQVSSQAVYRNYGYDHIVSIANGCDETVSCDVFTSANPEHQKVDVPRNQRADVLTFRGSPSRAFVAHVDCALVSAGH